MSLIERVEMGQREMPRQAMTGEEIRVALMQAARAIGCLVHHETDSRRTDSGWPDLLIIYPRVPRIIVVECKSRHERLRDGVLTASGRMMPSQADWLLAFASAQVQSYVVRPELWERDEPLYGVQFCTYDWLKERIESWQEL